MAKPALVTVIHDPKGKTIELFRKRKNQIELLYPECFITISHQTSQELKELLGESGFFTKFIPKLGAAHARREAIKWGLTGSSQHFHYCDFDRLLTWADRHYDELKDQSKTRHSSDYLILGRTERAFQTHPFAWKETEKLTNQIFSMEFGKRVDITTGSCLFSRASAQCIIQHSSAKVTDTEWPMIIHRMAKGKVGYREVEGLEYHEEVNGVNRVLSDSEEWLGRLKLSLLLSEIAVKTGKNS